MSLSATDHKYVQMDERGVPLIAGTTMKIVELIVSIQSYGWTPEQTQASYPHLSMAQIHSALAYYWDHKQTLDADIERRYQYAEYLRTASGETPMRRKLRSFGSLE